MHTVNEARGRVDAALDAPTAQLDSPAARLDSPVEAPRADVAAGRLPRIAVGGRRVRLGLLIVAGVVQAGLSVTMALLVPRLLAGASSDAWALAVVLLAVALGIGAVRMTERVMSESLAQHYVAEVRRLVVASALSPERGVNLGITVARTTNDLTAVRNWVALGIAPLAVAVPTVAGVVVALVLLAPGLGVAVAVALALFALFLIGLARPAYRRAREVRRVRGTLAAHIADTVIAADAIRVAGGAHRELAHIDRRSDRLRAAALARAVVSGALRGGAVTMVAVLAVLIAVVGAATGAGAGEITAGVLLAGLLATPVTDLGRVNEYRQGMRAAEAVLVPAIARARRFERWQRGAADEAADVPAVRATDARGTVARDAGRVEVVESGRRVLAARPGDRILLTGADDRVIAVIAGDRPDDPMRARIDGRELVAMTGRDRRRLVGVAAGDAALPRGSVRRIARYRVPETDTPVETLLSSVGTLEAASALPDGVRTTVRRGGADLPTALRAGLALASAFADDPPLVVLDRIDDALDRAGREALRARIAHYPGVVVMRTNDADRVRADGMLGRHTEIDGARWSDQATQPLVIPFGLIVPPDYRTAGEEHDGDARATLDADDGIRDPVRETEREPARGPRPAHPERTRGRWAAALIAAVAAIGLVLLVGTASAEMRAAATGELRAVVDREADEIAAYAESAVDPDTGAAFASAERFVAAYLAVREPGRGLALAGTIDGGERLASLVGSGAMPLEGLEPGIRVRVLEPGTSGTAASRVAGTITWRSVEIRAGDSRGFISIVQFHAPAEQLVRLGTITVAIVGGGVVLATGVAAWGAAGRVARDR